MVLYVAHGTVWHETMEDFIRWSLQYDLWCKMHFFGQAIEEQENAGMKNNAPGPQNLLDLLPEIFTREEAGMLRQRQGIRNGSLAFMLSNWKKRGYIELYGEEMPQKEINRQRYIKSEAYLKKHPQQAWSVGQLEIRIISFYLTTEQHGVSRSFTFSFVMQSEAKHLGNISMKILSGYTRDPSSLRSSG